MFHKREKFSKRNVFEKMGGNVDIVFTCSIECVYEYIKRNDNTITFRYVRLKSIKFL